MDNIMEYISDDMSREYDRRKDYSIEYYYKWRKYWDEPIFDLCEQSGSGPALVVPQGQYELEIPLKIIVLIKKCIESDPEILTKFLTAALGSQAISSNEKITKAKKFKRRQYLEQDNPHLFEITYIDDDY